MDITQFYKAISVSAYEVHKNSDSPGCISNLIHCPCAFSDVFFF